jgi:hypothetical protein
VDPRAGLDDVEKRKSLTLPGLELLSLGRPARSQSLYRLRYSDSPIQRCKCIPFLYVRSMSDLSFISAFRSAKRSLSSNRNNSCHESCRFLSDWNCVPDKSGTFIFRIIESSSSQEEGEEAMCPRIKHNADWGKFFEIPRKAEEHAA